MSETPTRVIAVDLGAGSARVAEVDLDAPTLEPRILHRAEHGPVEDGRGNLRWDWEGLVAEVERGLDIALSRGPVASIGIDTWGVDYGLIDRDGELVAPPFSYRDTRTEGWRDVAAELGEDRLYEITGIQLMAINTVFQLAAHDRAELEAAEQLLFLPELLLHHLTDTRTGERTSAGTSALIDVTTGDWSQELLAGTGVPSGLMPTIRNAPAEAGTYRGVPVHLVAGHDTASAFLAVPGIPGPGSVTVSTGTWVLAGAERAEADTSAEARLANFSNEPGALGGVRFLKNVTGFWLLEECRRQWGNPDTGELLAAAAGLTGDVPRFDPNDDRFHSPTDMEAEIRSAAGLPDADRATLVRSIVESVADGAASVIEELSGFTGHKADELFVIGGGARATLLNELLEERTGAAVRTGHPEATVLGNAIMQGLALGRFAELSEARNTLARSSSPEPQ